VPAEIGACSGARRSGGCSTRPTAASAGRLGPADKCQGGLSPEGRAAVAKLGLEHGINTNLLVKWRRKYRAGKFGAAGPADLVTPSAGEFPVPARDPEAAVTLMPVRVPTAEGDAVAATVIIEVVFACATVRTRGVPEVSSLRLVLD
jgi:transposase